MCLNVWKRSCEMCSFKKKNQAKNVLFSFHLHEDKTPITCKYGSHISGVTPPCGTGVFCVLFSYCLAVEHPWHGSVGIRSSCEAPARTGLCVIWHAVKDPTAPHSNCVPVGPSEPRSSLHRSATGARPRAGLREPGGARSVGSLWQAAHSPRFDIQQHPYTLTCLHTLSRERGRERERSACVPVVLLSAFNPYRFSREMQRKTTVLELLATRVSPHFFKIRFSAVDVSVSGRLCIPSVPGSFLFRLFICAYFSFAPHHHRFTFICVIYGLI